LPALKHIPGGSRPARSYGYHRLAGVTAPVCWETIPHVHKYDEFLIFLGAQLPDLCKSFDAEIDLWMGKELEKHTITSTTVVFIPKGMLHCPLNFRAIRKPVLFHALYLGPTLDARRLENSMKLVLIGRTCKLTYL